MEHVKIFQPNQIGGCVTVITSTYKGKTHRIMVDYGSSLPGSDNVKDFDYPWEEEPVDAVFFTHYHGDHVGRILEIPSEIPLYMGETARRVMLNIHEALGNNERIKDFEQHRKIVGILKDADRVRTFHWNGDYFDPVDIPAFHIEPYSIDHSAYDAYMFLFEADDEESVDGKYRVLHTGDFRGHGRRGKVMLPLIRSAVKRFGKRPVDTLVIEGTMMSRLEEKVKTETEMMMEAVECLHEHKHAFLICSSTNLDSLATFYQAAQAVAYPGYRMFYVYSSYYKTQLKTFTETAGGFSDIYKFKHVGELYGNNFDEPLPLKNGEGTTTKRKIMEKYGFIAAIKPEDIHEEYIDMFIDHNPVIIYSMWEGYLKDKPENQAKKQGWIDFLKRQEAKGIKVKHLHTSGHASAKMLAEVISEVNPTTEIRPMHTEYPEFFYDLPVDPKIDLKRLLDHKNK